MQKIKFWINNSRYHALFQSAMPALVACVAASKTPSFSLFLGFLAILGSVFVHLGLNLFDDYFDWFLNKEKIKQSIIDKGKSARFGKCLYLFKNETKPKELFIVASLLCIMGVMAGAVIFYYRGLPILYIALLAAFLGFFYSAPPLKLSYHGLGELTIGLMFGPLLMNGVYFAACGAFDFNFVYISIIIGILVTNIVYVHSVMDLKSDSAMNKKTLAVLLGEKKAYHKLLVFTFTPYLMILASLRLFGPIVLWALLMIIPSFTLIKYMYNSKLLPSPKWYLGPMEKWEKIKSFGLAPFMFRWYLARNILSGFCLILILLYLFYV